MGFNTIMALAFSPWFKYLSSMGFIPMMARISPVGFNFHMARIFLLGFNCLMAYRIPRWVSCFPWLAIPSRVPSFIWLRIDFMGFNGLMASHLSPGFHDSGGSSHINIGFQRSYGSYIASHFHHGFQILCGSQSFWISHLYLLRIPHMGFPIYLASHLHHGFHFLYGSSHSLLGFIRYMARIFTMGFRYCVARVGFIVLSYKFPPLHRILA